MPRKPSNSSITKSPKSKADKQNESKILKRLESVESNDNEEEDSLTDDSEQYVQESREAERYPGCVHFRPESRPLSPSNQKRILESTYSSLYSKTSKNKATLLAVEKARNKSKISNKETKTKKQKASKNVSTSESVNLQSKPSSVIFSKIGVYVLLAFLLLIFAHIIMGLYMPDLIDNESPYVSMELIKEKFPKQDDQFWKTIVSGINHTISSRTPTSYIFLFESEGEETTKKLLAEISKYAVFKLTNCNNNAIDFKEEVLKSPKFSNIHDYGSIIPHLKGMLESNGLMIIENLDEVPEKYAQAFHNFCDEYTPLVEKSAYFFTMKVDKFKESPQYDLRNIEKSLRKSWPNIEEDIFVPLFTRVSSMILRVYP